ncbi:hypothetical protein SteCoe_3467 [Stentor coeruleus]|uniref:UBX domain-containing protein n=1 Tax=Stentor coeruleus TaxID=5963 RepID=A0A1R2CWW4_9CILI|nr:hypothetical protein SteCoe_3467 [Stentor coeruleus]
MDNLQDLQKEAIANFQAITETWDSEQAIQVLQGHNWDVIKASNEFLSSSSHLSSSYISENSNPSIPRPNPLSTSISLQIPISWGKQLNHIFSSIWKSIVPEAIRGEISIPAQEFSNKMTEFCRAPVEFSSLRFQELLNYCHDKNLPLFIYLHAFSDEYPQELFSDSHLVSFLNKEYIYWGVEHSSDEGQMLKKLLNIEIFPFIAIIQVKNPKKPLVLARNSGYLDVRQLMIMLENHSNNANLELLQERRLRAQQQEELKEAERMIIIQEQKAKEKKKQEKKAQEIRDKQKQEKYEILKKNVGIEPQLNDITIFVSFKLPTGIRLDRNFDKNKKISVLYDYLEMNNIIATELVFGFPSKSLVDREKSLEEEGVYHKCVIHVREAN